MSMTGNFRTISDADMDALLARPKRVERLLYGEYFSETGERKGFFRFLRKKKQEPPDEWRPDDGGEGLYVDKAWHGIHYLLTGSVWEGAGPEAFILAGGEEIGDIDVGYGSALAFRSEEVAAIAGRLGDTDRDTLARACDRGKFQENEIYPDIWDEDTESCFGYVLGYYEDLKRFVSRAAQDGKALVVYIS